MQQQDKDLIVELPFSANEKKGKEINGMLVQRINSATGELISTSQSDINTSLITAAEDDDAEDKKGKRKIR